MRRTQILACLMAVFGAVTGGTSNAQQKQTEPLAVHKLPPAVERVVKEHRPKAVIAKRNW